LIVSSLAISLIVACRPFSNMSRHLNARAIALTIALSMRREDSIPPPGVPSGASTTFRPPRFRIEIGTRTVIVRPSLLIFGFAITLPFALA
jgi:hypothetical protein